MTKKGETTTFPLFTARQDSFTYDRQINVPIFEVKELHRSIVLKVALPPRITAWQLLSKAGAAIGAVRDRRTEILLKAADRFSN